MKPFIFLFFWLKGPPSQSLGVDPVDPAVMRRPPRKKNAPIITQKLLWRVLFSASIIVIGTLFVYVFALEDSDMSKREQTMVCEKKKGYFCSKTFDPIWYRHSHVLLCWTWYLPFRTADWGVDYSKIAC